jgi:hypothetical protein
MTDLAVDIDTPATCTSKRKGRTAKERPCIPLPNGDCLEPRVQWAEGKGITDRTARKLNLKTTYFGGVAYVLRNASTQQLAEHAQHRNEPHRRHGRKPTA